MKAEIEVSDDDNVCGHNDDKPLGSILVDPESAGVEIDPEADPVPYQTMSIFEMACKDDEQMPIQPQMNAHARPAACPAPRPSARRFPVRRNVRFSKAKKPDVASVKLVSAAELKEACEALAPAGSRRLVLELFCGAGKVARAASDSGKEQRQR